MSLKHDVAIGTASDIERNLAEALQATLDERLRIQGGKRALEQAKQRVLALQEHIEKLNNDGELSDEDREVAKKWLGVAFGAMESMWQTHDVAYHEQDGRIAGLRHALTMTGKVKESHESAKLSEAERNEANGDSRFGGRIPGGSGRFGGRTKDSEEEVPRTIEDMVNLYSKRELVQKARDAGVDASGTKADIAERLLDELQHTGP